MPRRLAIAIAFFVLACSGPPPPIPGAVIEETPSSVCVGDDFKTQIHVDSRGSSPSLTLVYSPPAADAGELEYAWTFSGNVCVGIPTDPSPCDVKIDPASLDPHNHMTSSDVLLTMSGNVPIQVTLALTVDGVTSTVQSTIAITLLEGGTCP